MILIDNTESFQGRLFVYCVVVYLLINIVDHNTIVKGTVFWTELKLNYDR